MKTMIFEALRRQRRGKAILPFLVDYDEPGLGKASRAEPLLGIIFFDGSERCQNYMKKNSWISEYLHEFKIDDRLIKSFEIKSAPTIVIYLFGFQIVRLDGCSTEDDFRALILSRPEFTSVPYEPKPSGLTH